MLKRVYINLCIIIWCLLLTNYCTHDFLQNNVPIFNIKEYIQSDKRYINHIKKEES